MNSYVLYGGSLSSPKSFTVPDTDPETKWPNTSTAMIHQMIPISLKAQLMPGTLETTIHTLVKNHMDMSVFDANNQNGESGRHAHDPKIRSMVV